MPAMAEGPPGTAGVGHFDWAGHWYPVTPIDPHGCSAAKIHLFCSEGGWWPGVMRLSHGMSSQTPAPTGAELVRAFKRWGTAPFWGSVGACLM